MKQFKLYVIILLLAVLIIPSVALAAWWNPFSWNIWQNIWNSIFYKQNSVSLECTIAKDCQTIYKNCYYSCSSNECVRINTLVALKPYPDCSSTISCTPNWQCGWGQCVIPPCVPGTTSSACTNGIQSMIVVDSNNCGLPSTDTKIACPALSRICGPSSQTSGEAIRKVGEKEFNFLIQKINTDSVDGLLYTLYPVAMLQGQSKTLHIGDMVGYACEGKTASLSSINVSNQTVIFDETIKNPPIGGCPI